MANALDQIQHKSSLLPSVCLFISHKLVALGGTGHYACIGEQFAAGQGRAGLERRTPPHAPSRTSIIFFLWEWDGKKLFSKSLPAEGLFAYDDVQKDALFPWVL
jgi:hypothetical protein